MLGYLLWYCNEYYQQEDYIEDSWSEMTNRVKQIHDREVAGITAEGYEWTTEYAPVRIMDPMEFTEFKFWVDPETKFILRYEEWSTPSGFTLNQEDTIDNDWFESYELTRFEYNCVTQQDVDDLIATYYDESGFRHITLDEYYDMYG